MGDLKFTEKFRWFMSISPERLTIHGVDLDGSLKMKRFYESNQVVLSSRGTANSLNGLDLVFDDLTNLSQVVALAVATSIGTASASSIIQIPGRYQRLVGTAQTTCELFVDSCLASVVEVQDAIDYCESENYAIAIERLAHCETIATQMVGASDKVLEEVQELWERTGNSLRDVTAADTKNKEDKENYQKEIKKLEFQKGEAEKNLKKYDASLERLATTAKEIKKMLPKEEGNAFWGNILVPEFGKVKSFVTEYLKKIPHLGKKLDDPRIEQLKTLSDKLVELQKKIEAKKHAIANATDGAAIATLELEKKQLEIEFNGVKTTQKKLEDGMRTAKEILNEKVRVLKEDLKTAETEEQRILDDKKTADKAISDATFNVTRLTTASTNSEQAKKSLELCLATLTKIQHVFAGTRLFWTRMQRQCRKLKIKDQADSAMRAKDYVKLKDKIRLHGLDWATVGWYSLQAQEKIDLAWEGVSVLTTELPVTDAQKAAMIARGPEILALINGGRPQ